MHKVQPICLSSLIEESKDGDWGKGECPPNHIQMLVIRGTDFDKVKSGTIDGIPKRCIPNAIAHRKKLKPNDILIETAGGTEDKPTGRVTFISEEYLNRYKQFNFTCASFSRFIRIDPKKANPLFIYWYLQFLYDARISYMFHTQHTGVARFQWTKFSICNLFVLPDRRIQKRIASVLISYDELIQVNNQRIKLLEETASQLYKEWFVRMRFPGYEKAKFEKGIPEDWKITTIANIANTKMGQSPQSQFYNEEGNGLPFHQGVGNYGLRFPEHKVFCSVDGRIGEEGDILFSVRAPVGRLNIADRKLIIGRGLAAMKHRKGLNNYLYYLLQNEFTKEDIIGNGSIFNSVGKDELKKFKVFDVGVLAKNFNDCVQPIDIQLLVLIQQNNQLRQIRDRLLPRLISGKLKLKDLKAESYNADVLLNLAAEPEPVYTKT